MKARQVNKRKNVAILFSGGDSPGMNAFARAFVRLGCNCYDSNILGVKDGYLGLVRSCQKLSCGALTSEDFESLLIDRRGQFGISCLDQDVVWLDGESVSGLARRGGIFLGCARCPEFFKSVFRREVVNLLAKLRIDSLVTCGGEGTLQGAQQLARESQLQVLGVPATIDNDTPGTETAIGVDTALNTIVEAVSRFSHTADSHHRIMVLEIMGRNSGYLAQTSALAAGAEIVVTPERGNLDEAKMRGIAERVERLMLKGRRHAIILVAEGVQVSPVADAGPAKALSDYLAAHFSHLRGPLNRIESRHSVLGHLQRGGAPSVADCILANQFAVSAWEEISANHQKGGILALTHGRMRLQPFGRSRRDLIRDRRSQYLLQKHVSKRWRGDSPHDIGQSERGGIQVAFAKR